MLDGSVPFLDRLVSFPFQDEDPHPHLFNRRHRLQQRLMPLGGFGLPPIPLGSEVFF